MEEFKTLKVMDRPARSTVYRSAHALLSNKERPHSGFSLIEILVTLLIMALSLSGWALLLAVGIITQHDAYARTQSTLLTSALLERIRMRDLSADASALAAYTKTTTEAELADCKIGGTTADNDRICWFRSLRENLPKGTGHISVGGKALHVESFWLDSKAADDARINSPEKCEDPNGADRTWSDNPIVNWIPPGSAPNPPSCLQVQRWSLPL